MSNQIGNILKNHEVRMRALENACNVENKWFSKISSKSTYQTHTL